MANDLEERRRKCPLCGRGAIERQSGSDFDHARFRIECQACGVYYITLEARVNLETDPASRRELHLLSGLARERSKLAESDDGFLTIRTDTLLTFQELAPKRESERIRRFLQLAASRVGRQVRSVVEVNRFHDYFMAFARDGDEFWNFLQDLKDRSLIKAIFAAGTGQYQFTLTSSGREYLERQDARESGTLPMKEPKTLEQLLAEDEGSFVERKASLRWDYNKREVNKEVLGEAVARAVAEFLNVRQGGYLLIGVRDDGYCLGLEKDYATITKRPNWDGFQQHLVNTLGQYLGNTCLTSIHPRKETKDGREICVVAVEFGPGPTFLTEKSGKQHFYVRIGNTTRELEGKELIEYTREKWSGK